MHSWEIAAKYHPDRVTLAYEIKETLRLRGDWVPNDWASSDLIQAVAGAINKRDEEIAKQREEIASLIEGADKDSLLLSIADGEMRKLKREVADLEQDLATANRFEPA